MPLKKTRCHPSLLGWRRDLPDHRDRFRARAENEILPTKIDLRPKCGPVYDQGELGSCTANATLGLVQMVEDEETNANRPTPSRLFQYYNTRVIEGTVQQDSGATIRQAIKAVVKYGYCAEAIWPYRVQAFRLKPPLKAYKAAEPHKLTASEYQRVAQTLQDLRSALAQNHGIVFGFSVYESFEKVGSDGMVHMPGSYESLLGGHAVMLVGYDDDKKVFIVRNSWGEGWGDKGYFYMPYNYCLNPQLSSDYWTITATPPVAA